MRSFWTGCRRKRSRLGWAMPPVQEAGCALVAARRLMSAGMGVALTRIRMAQQLERWGWRLGSALPQEDVRAARSECCDGGGYGKDDATDQPIAPV